MDNRDFNSAPRRVFQKSDPVSSLIELDLEMMKLLARRAKLVSRLRGGKDHAATPTAVKAEKEVRAAWEKNAVRFSRDEKFSRRFFSLLQELIVDSREESESRSSFNLAPSRRPAAVDLPAPASVMSTRLWAVLAAARGESIRIENAVLNDALLECVKALNQVGASLTWPATGRPGEGALIQSRKGGVGDEDRAGALVFPGAVLYAGEDLLTLYLLVFLALPQTGKVRFTGGAGLKMADLSPLRRFLPDLGARLAHSVPRSCGLPASLEISGVLPDKVLLPSDLPLEGVVALFCAACAWGKDVTIDLAALPARVSLRALAEILPILRACGIDDSLRGTALVLSSRAAQMPVSPAPAADPAICAYLLALPAFAGGYVTLAGAWPRPNPVAEEAARILDTAGLALELGEGRLHAECGPTPRGEAATFDLRDCHPALLPLALALAVAAAKCGRAPGPVLLPDDAQEAALSVDFFARFGLSLSADGALQQEESAPAAQPRDAASVVPWTSPGPYWTMAYALCAYVRPHLRLTNPAIMTELMPSFWALYNALPSPAATPRANAAPESEKPKTTRRRIVTE